MIHKISYKERRNLEQMGTKKKFWYQPEGRGNELWLYKQGRPATGEDWAEVVTCKICEQIGIPCAKYEFAHYENEKGFIISGVVTQSLVNEHERLIHGNELLTLEIPGYNQTKTFGLSAHTLEAIFQSLLSFNVQVEPPLSDFGLKASDLFIGYLLLDTLISNTDRHHENWGIIQDEQTGINRLAPSFDHGSSLGCRLSDEDRIKRLHSKDKGYQVSGYVENAHARSAIFNTTSDKTPMKMIEAFNNANKYAPRGFSFWLEKVSLLDEQIFKKILNEIEIEKMSSIAKEFTLKMLKSNKNRLLNLRR